MEASRHFPTFLWVLSGLRTGFGKREPARPSPRAAAFAGGVAASAARATVAERPRPSSIQHGASPTRPLAPRIVAAQPVAPVAEPPPPAKTMRSLEEVRADLARMRETAKERHARLQVRREVSFAPTDFMDLAEPATARHDSEPDADFPATAFAGLREDGPTRRR